MSQSVRIDVIHEATQCPAEDAAKLEKLLANFEHLADQVDSLSGGKVNIVVDWYDRNEHTFHYLVETDLRIAQAEDILKQALGLSALTVRSFPTESGEQALEVLQAKLKKLQSA